MRFLLIAAGGGIGALLRFALTAWIQRTTEDPFPVGTVAVNVLGCLLIGFLGTVLAGSTPVRDEWRFFALVGLLGGFTTFSTFGYETISLLNFGLWERALANVALSNVLGLIAVWAGYRLAHFANLG